VRSNEAAAAFAEKGIATRRGDYNDIDSLEAAFQGVDRLLVISSSDIGQREAQHANIVRAAKAAGVGFIAYTSILHATENPMALAQTHIRTETMLAESGIPHTFLRNGWYTENFYQPASQALESGRYFGASGDGKFSTASRKDFGEAAAIVLAGGHDGEVLELAGDTAFTMTEFIESLSEESGKPVAFVNVPEEAIKDGLMQAGLPDHVAAVVADSDAKAADNLLLDDSRTLSKLIGRATTPYVNEIKAFLA
jgi:NAD(P)H dehydrogenase (quinone)